MFTGEPASDEYKFAAVASAAKEQMISSATYNGSASITHTRDTGGLRYYGYVKDAAGNTCSSSQNFKKDFTAPSVPYCTGADYSGLTRLSTSCNGSQDCNTIFRYDNSGYWKFFSLVVQYDNLSGLNDVQEYMTCNRRGSSCYWIPKNDCLIINYDLTYPLIYDNKFRAIDNAGNVSGVAECDYEVRQ